MTSVADVEATKAGRGRRRWIKRAVAVLAVVAALGAAGGAIVWWKFFLPGDQRFADDRERFLYGSLGAELIAGIPYPIFMILPRVFPDLVERFATEGYGPEKLGHGGYGAFGLPWEEGQRLPAGLSIRRLGFERVTVNCAACHVARYRLGPGEPAQYAVGGPGHTVNLQGLLRFLFAAANDRRFTAARIMPELALHFDLDWLDWAIYPAVLIPKTRLALKLGERELAWMDDKPAWAPGRDDAFNLPKYLLTRAPWDDTVGNTDFPAVWRLGERDGHLIHSAGEAESVAAVVASSALGVGSLPGEGFAERNAWLERYLGALAPPAYPLPIDGEQAAEGEALFVEHCAGCHAPDGARTGTAIPLDEIGTDPEHVLTWSDEDARRMNRIAGLLGYEGAALQGAQGGFVAKPLVGVWLLGPYLHNGSVPTVRDLLTPPAERPTVFFRGYDVIDPERLGFVSSGPQAEVHGFRFDTALRGNGNGGHDFGTLLPEGRKRALIEYLKGL